MNLNSNNLIIQKLYNQNFYIDKQKINFKGAYEFINFTNSNEFYKCKMLRILISMRQQWITKGKKQTLMIYHISWLFIETEDIHFCNIHYKQQPSHAIQIIRKNSKTFNN